MRTFDLIRDAVLPEFRERVADYLIDYETALADPATDPQVRREVAYQLRGYLRGLNTTRVLGMADWEELDRRVMASWLAPQ
ncbi:MULTISPECIES: hypothetical protein [Pseudomonas]|uniref:Transcriptional regulator n=1 Tax=Pseudomonas sessilinigenes TaxID=658629 RepID=A0ABX8MY65_9PSED|nr:MULTISPECIES: hypothetical protein [Pseudomonas]AZC24705.1 hypothetical protein C4K39_3031 [Pseudomonas sessilinigenes]QIH08179.1 hypothetical protein ATY02_16445 [Pseudomonas sp. BIOMIG1BAC]QXH43628.1 hypothetical protein KSS89_15810 [Pseudomonas sessilinigenes]UMZ14921.1 hypothetical protein I9018_14975 [Pseudomonas sp. MPFS]